MKNVYKILRKVVSAISGKIARYCLEDLEDKIIVYIQVYSSISEEVLEKTLELRRQHLYVKGNEVTMIKPDKNSKQILQKQKTARVRQC